MTHFMPRSARHRRGEERKTRYAMLPAVSTPRSNGLPAKDVFPMALADAHTNGRLASPVSAAEVASVRARAARASLLPQRAYHDPDVLAYGLEAWFAGGWVCIGREEDIDLPGQYFLTKLCNENLIIVRDNDRTVRGFFNFCRHRGAT